MQVKSRLRFPKLAIVGKGAIGGLVGFKCHQLGYDYQHLIKNQSHHTQYPLRAGAEVCRQGRGGWAHRRSGMKIQIV